MKFFLFLSFLAFSTYGLSQSDTVETVRYDFSYEFNEGLFIDFINLKNNTPVPFERIESPTSNDIYFFDLLEEAKTVSYYDDFGNLQEIDKNKIWGYGKNGKPYINWAGKFYMIPSVGSISHFAALVKVYYSSGHDPFYSPYYYNYNYYPTRTYQSEELRQFLIDFNSGEVFPYEYKSVEKLLDKSPELQAEYSKLGKRKKSKRMFEYVKRYNELNPLYLPVN